MFKDIEKEVRSILPENHFLSNDLKLDEKEIESYSGKFIVGFRSTGTDTMLLNRFNSIIEVVNAIDFVFRDGNTHYVIANTNSYSSLPFFKIVDRKEAVEFFKDNVYRICERLAKCTFSCISRGYTEFDINQYRIKAETELLKRIGVSCEN